MSDLTIGHISELIITIFTGNVIGIILVLVIIVIKKTKNLQKESSYMVLNMLVANFLSTTTANTLVILSTTKNNRKNMNLCLSSLIITEAFYNVSNLSIITICLQRYFKLASESLSKHFADKKMSRILILLIWVIGWILSIIFNFPYDFYLNGISEQQKEWTCTYGSHWTQEQGYISIVLTQFFPPIIVLTIYLMFFIKIKKLLSKETHKNSNQDGNTTIASVRNKTVFVALIIVILKIVFILPSTVLDMIDISTRPNISNENTVLELILQWMYYLYPIGEAITVLFLSREIGIEVVHIFSFGKIFHNKNIPTNDQTYIESGIARKDVTNTEDVIMNPEDQIVINFKVNSQKNYEERNKGNNANSVHQMNNPL